MVRVGESLSPVRKEGVLAPFLDSQNLLRVFNMIVLEMPHVTLILVSYSLQVSRSTDVLSS